MYKLLIRPLLFWFDPEEVHYFTFSAIRFSSKIPGFSSIFRAIYVIEDKRLETEVFGLKFKNPVGLAAGFDKDAVLYNELSNFGFGFIEIGTLTPKGQDGNPKKRLFRLKQDGAIINRMGFNNDGADIIAARLNKWRKNNTESRLIIGGNIGKNKITPNEQAVKDYEICYKKLYDVVDYFVVNVSSPNTPGLRELQEKESLRIILTALQKINQVNGKKKPLLLKISPDLSNDQINDVTDLALDIQLDGLVVANTTIDRTDLKTSKKKVESIGYGGLSGSPLKDKSNDMIAHIHQLTKGMIPIIGSGGIMTPKDAKNKIYYGATLVQIWTGFVYEGPGLIKKIVRYVK
jgi:dihydroorotate dehydrogenase